MLHIAGVSYDSMADGEGVRCAIFVSGCTNNCIGCHNPQTHNFNYGTSYSNDIYLKIHTEIENRPYLSGITFSGGDPMHPNNIEYVSKIIHDFKCDFPDKTIWVYTGYTYEYLFKNYYFALTNIDILVDGKFEIDKKDTTLSFRGSSNQRIIDVQKSLKQNKLILWKDGDYK